MSMGICIFMSPSVLGVSAYLPAESADRYHWGELNHLLLDQMRLEVARLIRRESARATSLVRLQRTFEMAEFDAEPCKPGGTKGSAGSQRVTPVFRGFHRSS